MQSHCSKAPLPIHPPPARAESQISKGGAVDEASTNLVCPASPSRTCALIAPPPPRLYEGLVLPKETLQIDEGVPPHDAFTTKALVRGTQTILPWYRLQRPPPTNHTKQTLHAEQNRIRRVQGWPQTKKEKTHGNTRTIHTAFFLSRRRLSAEVSAIYAWAGLDCHAPSWLRLSTQSTYSFWGGGWTRRRVGHRLGFDHHAHHACLQAQKKY